jgi:hypothetical protein
MCSLFSDSGGVNIEKAPIVEQLNRAQSAFPDVSGVKVTCTPEKQHINVQIQIVDQNSNEEFEHVRS